MYSDSNVLYYSTTVVRRPRQRSNWFPDNAGPASLMSPDGRRMRLRYLYPTKCEDALRMDVQMTRRWIADGLQMDCRWIADGLRMDCRWIADGLQMNDELADGHADIHLVQELHPQDMVHRIW